MIYAPYHSEGWFGFDTEKSSLIYEKKNTPANFFLIAKKKIPSAIIIKLSPQIIKTNRT